MDGKRFDDFARTFTARRSRRSAMRTGGLGIVATLLGVTGLRRASAQQASGTYYTMIRRYTLSGSSDEVVQVLNDGYLPLLSEQDGFVQYSVVTSTANNENRVTTVTVFESRDQYETATQNEAEWVQENLASLLPTPGEETAGDAVIYSLNTDLICDAGPAPTEAATTPTSAPATETATAEPTPCTGIGCACNGGVEGACDDGLVCCQSQMSGGPVPGGAGQCAAANACGDDGNPCTGIGCACNGGVEGACDDGLVCCQSQMNGGSTPGGAGQCAAASACGDDNTSCTGIGCACNGGVQGACDDGLVCCQSHMGSDGDPVPGGPGLCAAADACGDDGDPCGDIGCACTSGVQGACNDGLVCCQSQMGGGPVPGGAGQCAAEDACGDDGSTASPAADA